MIEQELVSWTPADMLEISLDEPDDFLKIKETLTRIGVSSKKEHNTLYQSCHILHKQWIDTGKGFVFWYECIATLCLINVDLTLCSHVEESLLQVRVTSRCHPTGGVHCRAK